MSGEIFLQIRVRVVKGHSVQKKCLALRAGRPFVRRKV
jgi:hypothetical protein